MIQKEGNLHLNAIRSIAKETGFTEKDVGFVYETILEKLKEHARIKDYLPVLVIKEVKDMLMKSMESGH
ncbi:MAG TPA: DUF3562 domain-containing protein [Candidatus Brocadiaceae bacterium]|nr:DUF3562 domain-containing protein [Candidatus Brocadiaceae bacterium]